MAKKLTQEMLERMVMQVLNESNMEEGFLDKYIKPVFGSRTTTPMDRMRKGPDFSKFSQTGEFTAEDMLMRLANDPKLPKLLKQEIEFFFEPVYRKDSKDSTSKESEMTGLSSAGGAPSAEISAPGAKFSKKESIPELPRPSQKTVRSTVAYGSVAESKLEALVAEVLAEMSKEKPTAKKKEDLEGLEAHYGEEMRAGIKGKHSHKSRMAALQAGKKADKK